MDNRYKPTGFICLHRTYLDVAMNDVRAVHVLKADEHLVQKKLHVLIGQELRRSNELVQIGVYKLENLPRWGREVRSPAAHQE